MSESGRPTCMGFAKILFAFDGTLDIVLKNIMLIVVFSIRGNPDNSDSFQLYGSAPIYLKLTRTMYKIVSFIYIKHVFVLF